MQRTSNKSSNKSLHQVHILLPLPNPLIYSTITTQSQTPNSDIQQSLKVRIDGCTSALECLDDAIIIIAGSEDTNNNLHGKILYQRSETLVVAL